MSDIIKALKNIKNQLDMLEHLEEVDASANAQPEKTITPPENNISNELRKKNKQLEAKNRNYFRKCASYRRQIRELKSVNRNQRFVFMNKVDELKRVNNYLKEELFQSKEDQIEVMQNLREMTEIKNGYAEECRFYKGEARTNLILSQMRFTPQEHNGVMSNYHTNFNPNKTTCFICTGEKYSYTRICCGMGICFDCFLNNYQKKLERRVEGVQLVIGYDCPACGQRVSNSPEAIDPSLRGIYLSAEDRWGNDDGEGW